MFVSLLALGTMLFVLPTSGASAGPAKHPVAQDRSVDAVTLQGSAFPKWSAGPELTFRRPQVVQPTPVNPSDCEGEAGSPYDNSTDHSCNQRPDVAIYGNPAKSGAPVNQLIGYAWDGLKYVEIPLQVDERFTRYLSNNASGFALYSGVDQHLTYAFDREGFRFTWNAPGDPCTATPRGGIVAQPDPIAGLDDNDEVTFMWRDASTKTAPSGTPLPTGIKKAYMVRVDDPSDPGATRYAYVALAESWGPRPTFNAANGYVNYQRDANDLRYYRSQSSYGNYGAAPKGPVWDPVTNTCKLSPIEQRRPLDAAWITTDKYRFRYEGRWLMTELHIKQANGTYGPDVVDRWKARAFAQDPGSETPCCGYEEEDTNWGGSSILLGERSGPVRTIRETWGADSGTNVIRRETFYRDQIQLASYLRVHVIPPLDGIYTQWDYAAGRMSKYYNPEVMDGKTIDGKNDEVFGNLDDPCNPRYDGGDGSQIDGLYRTLYQTAPLCSLPYHQSVDVMDPTMSAPGATLQWEEVAGNYGSLVDRWAINQVTPGGAVQGVVALPYYRDDSCFDDGTGTEPGPKMHLRSGDEPLTYTDGTGTHPRKCWDPTTDPLPDPSFVASAGGFANREGDERYVQGDIGAHGLHLMFQVDSDNVSLTEPITEIDSVQRMNILQGNPGNVGDRYGRWSDFPLTATATLVVGAV